jgi:hypothetical protein
MSKMSTKGQWNTGFSTVLASNLSIGHNVAKKMTVVVPTNQTVVTYLPGSSRYGCQHQKENKKWTHCHPIRRKKRNQIQYYNNLRCWNCHSLLYRKENVYT